jgi:hypothetical protein
MGEEMKRLPVACPDPARWLWVAAGTESPELSAGLTEHAAECQACASHLREAIRVMSDEDDAAEDVFVAALESSRPAWQKEMAGRLGSGRKAEAPRQTPWWNRRLTWALAVLMVALVVGVASVSIFGPRRIAPKAAVASQVAVVAAATLEPMTTRGVGDVISLKLTPGTEWVDITLQFVDAPPPRLSVQFLDAADREVWRADADTDRGQVTVRLPATKLPEGDYHVSAGPITGSGKHVSYAFRATY